MVGSASPWKSCTRGRWPVYPLSIARTRSPHSCPVCVTEPPAHWLLQDPSGSPTAQHPAGTPAKAEPPLKTSGYTASMPSVIMPPEESPVMYTRSAFAEYLVSVYPTISATACVSPPPSCVSDFVEPTSQQLLLVCGTTMMKPY